MDLQENGVGAGEEASVTLLTDSYLSNGQTELSTYCSNRTNSVSLPGDDRALFTCGGVAVQLGEQIFVGDNKLWTSCKDKVMASYK